MANRRVRGSLPSGRRLGERTEQQSGWQLPGFPQLEAEDAKEAGEEAESEDDEEVDEKAEQTRCDNNFARGEIGIITTPLASDMHKVHKVLRDMPAADTGLIIASDIHIRIDNVDLKDTLPEAVEVLLTGPPGSEVDLKLLSENGNSKVVQLQRVALH